MPGFDVTFSDCVLDSEKILYGFCCELFVIYIYYSRLYLNCRHIFEKYLSRNFITPSIFQTRRNYDVQSSMANLPIDVSLMDI